MALCLIAPYGGTFKWIRTTLRNSPRISRVIILANSDQSRKDEKNRFKMACDFAEKMRIFESELPAVNKRIYNPVEIPYEEDFSKVYAFIRCLLLILINKYHHKFIIHLDSGPTMWRICLFQNAIEFAENISKLIIYDKIKEKEQIIPIFNKFNKVEQNILKILQKNDRQTISEIYIHYSMNYEEKSLSYILKRVNELTKKGFTKEEKIGRNKIVTLTPFAKEILSMEKYQKSIDGFLNN